MIEALIQRWRQFSPRERRLTWFAFALAACAGTYLALIEPAWQARQAIAGQLPLLRLQVAEADTLVIEARALSASASAAARPSLQALRLRVEQSLESAGLKPALQQMQATDSLIDVRLRDVSFAAWITWLDAVLKETRLRVADLSVMRDTEPGRVSVRLVLELAGGGR